MLYVTCLCDPNGDRRDRPIHCDYIVDLYAKDLQLRTEDSLIKIVVSYQNKVRFCFVYMSAISH